MSTFNVEPTEPAGLFWVWFLTLTQPEGDIRRKIGCRLSNVGSSCYQNVVLQLLVNLPEIRDRLLAFSQEHETCEDSLCFPRDLSRHIIEAAEHARAGATLSARWVLRYQEEAQHLIGQMFKQSDPADFLHALLDYCHDRATHKLPWLLELMQGSAYEQEWVDPYAFPDCQAKARDLAVQPFVTLNVPIPASQDSSLEECMASAVFEEKVVGGRECTCSHAPHAKVQQLRLKTVPQLLTLRLLRFDNSLRKLRSRISFPSVLDLSAYDSAADDTPTMLELVAVTVHHGRTRQRGHYFCFIKLEDNGRKLWWLFDDDSRHCEVEEDKVFAMQDQVYMLVYRRVTADQGPANQAAGVEQEGAGASESAAAESLDGQGSEEHKTEGEGQAAENAKVDEEDGDMHRLNKKSRL